MLLFGKKEKRKYDRVLAVMLKTIEKLEKENRHLKSEVVRLSAERMAKC